MYSIETIYQGFNVSTASPNKSLRSVVELTRQRFLCPLFDSFLDFEGRQNAPFNELSHNGFALSC
jgi:hypothetical protein